MYLAGYIVTGFLVAAAHAVGRLRGRWGRYERTALAIPLTIAALCSPVQVLVGDWNGREVARAQPTKLAALGPLTARSTSAPGSATWSSRSKTSLQPSLRCRGLEWTPVPWNAPAAPTAPRRRGLPTPMATGSNWCNGLLVTLTGSPPPTSASRRHRVRRSILPGDEAAGDD
jgi:bd-type cytochrome oxidase subunit I